MLRKDEVVEGLLGDTGGCGVDHAPGFDSSCGAINHDTPNWEPDYRCDRRKGHQGRHHVCGHKWEVEW